MKFTEVIRKLHKRGFVTEKPHPLIPFILGFVSWGLLIIIYRMNDDFFNKFKLMLVVLTIFTFVFAIIHYIVWKVVKKR